MNAYEALNDRRNDLRKHYRSRATAFVRYASGKGRQEELLAHSMTEDLHIIRMAQARIRQLERVGRYREALACAETALSKLF